MAVLSVRLVDDLMRSSECASTQGRGLKVYPMSPTFMFLVGSSMSSTCLHSSPLLMSVCVCVSRMKEGQKDIFYMAADSLDAASSAPFVERLVQRDFEVSSLPLLLRLVPSVT